MSAYDPVDLTRPLRPQGFGRSRPTNIDDPLVEPIWPGLRVLAAVGEGTATLFDDGAPIDDHADIRTAVARATATTSDGVILDGYITTLVASEGVGVDPWVNEYPTAGGQLSRLMIGGSGKRLEEMLKRRETEAEAPSIAGQDDVNFVVVDLLWLDGDWLLEIPLLERRRILDAILPGDELVRPGPYVRPPIGTWIGSWRAQGFRDLAFKAANSRYRPGAVAADWAQAPMPRR